MVDTSTGDGEGIRLGGSTEDGLDQRRFGHPRRRDRRRRGQSRMELVSVNILFYFTLGVQLNVQHDGDSVHQLLQRHLRCLT